MTNKAILKKLRVIRPDKEYVKVIANIKLKGKKYKIFAVTENYQDIEIFTEKL